MTDKKTEFPEMFDVLHIDYVNGCQGLAFAPIGAVEIGEKVITTFDEGTVKAQVKYVTPEDNWLKMICNMYSVDKITNKIIEVRYIK
jgi:hypothetical protein